MFWNSSPIKAETCDGRVPSVDGWGGWGRVRGISQEPRCVCPSHYNYLSQLLQSANSPGAALSLILGLAVVDSKLLCHLFFACCYFPSFFFPFFSLNHTMHWMKSSSNYHHIWKRLVETCNFWWYVLRSLCVYFDWNICPHVLRVLLLLLQPSFLLWFLLEEEAEEAAVCPEKVTSSSSSITSDSAQESLTSTNASEDSTKSMFWCEASVLLVVKHASLLHWQETGLVVVMLWGYEKQLTHLKLKSESRAASFLGLGRFQVFGKIDRFRVTAAAAHVRRKKYRK